MNSMVTGFICGLVDAYMTTAMVSAETQRNISTYCASVNSSVEAKQVCKQDLKGITSKAWKMEK